MKTYRMKISPESSNQSDVQVIVKVYFKHPDEENKTNNAGKHMTKLWQTLTPAKYPNLLPYQMWLKSPKVSKNGAQPIYLIRQFIHSNLHDRLATRPFLYDIEKLWLIFQLFKCLETCHSSGICHGDIRPDNVLVTTWNFIILTDFSSSFKPTSIPIDNPTVFQYYFDGMYRSRCYIAPERFKSGLDKEGNYPDDTGNLTYAMDVFSLGCTFAEVWLDGEAILDLPGMLRYLSSPNCNRLDHEDSPARGVMNKISNKIIRDVILDMTQRDPTQRKSVQQYRLLLQGILNGAVDTNIPPSPPSTADKNMPPTPPLHNANNYPFKSEFEDILLPFYMRLHWCGYTPDDRINIICTNFQHIMEVITNTTDAYANNFFAEAMSSIPGLTSQSTIAETISLDKIDALQQQGEDANVAKSLINSLPFESLLAARKRSDADSNVYFKELLSDVIKIDLPNGSISNNTQSAARGATVKEENYSSMSLDELMKKCTALLQGSQSTVVSSPPSSIPVTEPANINHYNGFNVFESYGDGSNRTTYDSLVLIIQLICSNFRQLKFPQSKLISLMLIIYIGKRCRDEVILQRISPLLISATTDPVSVVKATAVRALKALLSLVHTFATYEADIFPLYFFPQLDKFFINPTSNNPEGERDILVKIACAEALGTIAEVSKRFLDKAHMLALSKNISIDSDGRGTTATSSETVDFPYDCKLQKLRSQISTYLKELLNERSAFSDGQNHLGGNTAYSSMIKRIILADSMKLSVFFGQYDIVDELLHYVLTFLNDTDWEVRLAFCYNIPAVCVFVGNVVTSQYILPLFEKCLFDVEEKVIVQAINCLTTLVQMQLLSNDVILQAIKDNITALLLHPSQSIRSYSNELIAAIVQRMGTVDAYVFILPLLRPILQYDLIGVTLNKETIQNALIEPISRRGYNHAILRRMQILATRNPSMTRASNQSVVGVDMASLSLDSIDYNDADSSRVGSDEPAVTTDTFSSLKPIREDADGTLSYDDKYTGGGSNINDATKLGYIRKYLESAANEVHTKTVQWRHTNGTNYSNPASSPYQRHQRSYGNVDSILVTNTFLDTKKTRCYRVPHQKYGIHNVHQTIPDSVRGMEIHLDNDKSHHYLRQLYGISDSNTKGRGVLTVDTTLFNNDNYFKQDNSYVNSDEVEQLNKHMSMHMQINKPNRRASVSSVMDEYYDNDPSLPSNGAGRLRFDSASSPVAESANNLPAGVTRNKINAPSIKQHAECRSLIKRIKALDIPPLPADFGFIGVENRKYGTALKDAFEVVNELRDSRNNWRPKESLTMFIASLNEHSRAVNRLAVSPDNSFFASASSDKTVKIWQCKGLDHSAFPRSSFTYSGHQGVINDVTFIENTHSIASCSSDGTVHVWRVDVTAPTSQSPAGINSSTLTATSTSDGSSIETYDDMYNRSPNAGLNVAGTYSLVRNVDAKEGPVIALQHFNSDIASILVYVTQKGVIHGWDLRSSREVFKYTIRPELGSPTTLTGLPERSWICVGTSRGYVCLWDLRYNIMCKLWRHSSMGYVHRLECCKALSKSIGGYNNVGAGLGLGSNSNLSYTDGAYLFVAAGNSEAAVFGIPEGGECLKCFRSIPLSDSRKPLGTLPHLMDVPLPNPPDMPIPYAYDAYIRDNAQYKRSNTSDSPIYSMICNVSSTSSSYVITAGCDKMIRFWDFSSPGKCCTIWGLESQAQPKPTFEAPLIMNTYDNTSNNVASGKLFVCYDTALPTIETISHGHLPICEGRGPIAAVSKFKDAILDLKCIELPSGTKMLVSAGRDGEIKLFK